MLADIPMRLRVRVLLTLLTAAGLCLALTPVVRGFARRIGAMDVPDDARRIHDHPIPRLGGLAIYLSFCVAVLVFAPLSLPVQGILFGSVVMVMTGAIDDLVSLRPWVKLILQCVAAAIPVAFGLRIQFLANPTANGEIMLGVLTVPVTVLWIVGVSNALNLIDGVDGLAAGVSGISCASTLAVSLFVPEATDASLLLGALGGACLGFLPFNRNPAKIFMGDSGALLLGYVLATSSVLGLFKSYAIVTLAVPLLTLALPLADTVFAIVRRLHRHQSPMQADREHIHHRLMAMGLSQKQTTLLLWSVSAIFGILAVLLAAQGVSRLWLLLSAALIVVAVWVWLRSHRTK